MSVLPVGRREHPSRFGVQGFVFLSAGMPEVQKHTDTAPGAPPRCRKQAQGDGKHKNSQAGMDLRGFSSFSLKQGKLLPPASE